MSELIDLLLHVDVYLLDLIANYGVWIYAILFAIIFCETGLIVTPFLPGDSLLFVAGTIALPPCRSKNSCALTMYAGLIQRPHRGSVFAL